MQFMQPIHSDLKSFTAQLPNVECPTIGYWKPKQPNFMEKYIIGEKSNIQTVVLSWLEELNQLEQGADKNSFQAYIDACRHVKDFAHPLIAFNRTVYQDLERRSIALDYRAGQLNGGKDKEFIVSHDVFVSLQELAKKWKAKDPVFKDKELTIQDIKKLKKAAMYTDFAALILKNPILQKRFFDWSLKYHLKVSLFVEYPTAQEQIEKTPRFKQRMGFYQGKNLKIIKSNDGSKYLSFRINSHENLNFFGNETVQIGQQNYSMRDIIQELNPRSIEPKKLELFKSGVQEWNNNKFHQNLDLTDEKNWWKKIPVTETLTFDQVLKRYQCRNDKGVSNPWFVGIASISKGDQLTFDDSHAYFEIAIPNGQVFDIYTFSKDPNFVPKTAWQAVRSSAETYEAHVASPDRAIFNIGTRREYFGVMIDEEQGQTALSSIRKDLLLVENNPQFFVYQRLVYNCAHWALKHLQVTVGAESLPEKMFRVNYMNLQPTGMAGIVLKGLNCLPHSMSDAFLHYVYQQLGSTVEKTSKENGVEKSISLARVSPWKEGSEMYHPNWLKWYFKQHMRATL